MTGEIACQAVAAVLTCWAGILALRAAMPRAVSDHLHRLRRQPTSWTGGGSADPDMIVARQAALAIGEADAMNAEQDRAGRLNRYAALLGIAAAVAGLAASLLG